MKQLYLLSILFAMLSVLPVTLLVLKSERGYKKNIRIIRSSHYKSIEELEQRIREVWWEAHFDGDDSADRVVVIRSGKMPRKVCKKLKGEFPALIIKSDGELLKYLRNENNGEEKMHRA